MNEKKTHKHPNKQKPKQTTLKVQTPKFSCQMRTAKNCFCKFLGKLVNFIRVLIGSVVGVFEGLIEVLEERYEWSFRSWAVRSKPTATGMPDSYLQPNRNSLQKPI